MWQTYCGGNGPSFKSLLVETLRKIRVLGREREKITSSRGEKNQKHLKWFTNGGSGQAAPDVGQVGNLQT